LLVVVAVHYTQRKIANAAARSVAIHRMSVVLRQCKISERLFASYGGLHESTKL